MKSYPSLFRGLLAASILVCALSAQAITLVQPNTGGGNIVLTGNTCPKPGFAMLKQAYTYISNGNSHFGCWTVMDGLIHISWDNGNRSIFAVDSFTVKEEAVKSKPVRQGIPL